MGRALYDTTGLPDGLRTVTQEVRAHTPRYKKVWFKVPSLSREEAILSEVDPQHEQKTDPQRVVQEEAERHAHME